MPKSRYTNRRGNSYGGRRSSPSSYRSYSSYRGGNSYYSSSYAVAPAKKKPKVGWEQYTKDELKAHCKERSLSTTGSKGDLINRLDSFIAQKNAEAAREVEEQRKKAELEAEAADEAAMCDALAMVEQTISPKKTKTSILTKEQRERIEQQKQAALLKRQGSLTSSYSSLPLSQSSQGSSSSPLNGSMSFSQGSQGSNALSPVKSAPVINPYAKKASMAVKSSPQPNNNVPGEDSAKSSLPTLPPLPPDAPPIRQYTLNKLSDMQLQVVEAARPPTAQSSLCASGSTGLDQKMMKPSDKFQNDAFHPIVRVTAAAGTGKTTTLLHLALRCIDLGHENLTYVTYSKASAVDAQTRIQALLPDDKKACIHASTLHSCAMGILKGESSDADAEKGLIFEEKFRDLIEQVCAKNIERYLQDAYHHMEHSTNKSSPNEVRRKMKRAYDQVIFWLTKSFNSFCIRDMSLEKLKDEKNQWRHYYPVTGPVWAKGGVAEKLGFPSSYSSEQSYRFFADQCVILWEYVIDNGIRTFDIEIKRAQLNQVQIPGSVLLVDECQDLDACQVDLIRSQLQYGTAIFFVGDAAQTIYSFRGAKSSNYMSLSNAIDLCLNKSRFGPSIARVSNVPLFAKEYSPQTNKYLFSKKKQWVPYRIEGARGEEESSVTTESLLSKSNDVGTITFIARTNFALMFKAMEVMGLGSLVASREEGDELQQMFDGCECEENISDTPATLLLGNVPKFHINGEGDMSGLKSWRRTTKEIRHLFDFCETGKAGAGATKLPENIFPEFADKIITWKEFIDECKDRELNKYVKPIAIIDKYGSNTMKALEAFEGEVLDKKYSAEEADIILTTCHAAKGLEWDHVEICDDFVDLASRSYSQDAPVCNGPEFLSSDKCKKTRVGWQLNLQAYGDDINLLYVACTRAKKTLVVPNSVQSLFADMDLIYYLVRDMMGKKDSHSKDDLSTYTSLNKKGKNDGRLSKEELWHLYNDVCKPLREELGVGDDAGILSSFSSSPTSYDDVKKEADVSNLKSEEEDDFIADGKATLKEEGMKVEGEVTI